MKNRYIWLLSAGHMFTDLNQGSLPAILPFLIMEKNFSYTEVAGLVFAATFVSSVIQPLFGYYADKISKAWLMPVGLFLAGLGIALTGLLSSYWAMFIAVTISGIGIAAFHPEAARLANRVSGAKTGTGISIFAVGGNVGFALGPVITTAALVVWGLKGTLILLVPAGIMAVILVTQAKKMAEFQKQMVSQHNAAKAVAEVDDWNSFSKLTLIVVCRSVIFYGLNTFLPLYWIHILQQSKAAGGTALTILFTVGSMGTLFGGQLADRFGYVRVIRIGYLVLFPLLLVFGKITNAMTANLMLVPIALCLFTTYSPMVVLGQKYLPNRIGLASGVTFGLAVSIGGITTPVLGWLADTRGLTAAMNWIVYIPVIVAILAFSLNSPGANLAKKETGKL